LIGFIFLRHTNVDLTFKKWRSYFL